MVHGYKYGRDAKQQYQQIGQRETHPFLASDYDNRNGDYRQQCHRSVKPKVFAGDDTVG
jgi:hypothetical protein